MDIISLVIGTSGLVAFAELACDITRVLHDSQSFPKDMVDMLCELSFETTKVQCWSLEAAALRIDEVGSSVLGTRNQELLDLHKKMMNDCSHGVGVALHEIDRITRKYAGIPPSEKRSSQASHPNTSTKTSGLDYALRDGTQLSAAMLASSAVPHSTQAFQAKIRSLEATVGLRKLSKMSKISAVLKPWGESDKESLKRNIQSLAGWNKRLYSLLPTSEIVPANNRVRTVLIRDFDERRMLEGIGKVTRGQDPEISKSATLAIRVLGSTDDCPGHDCLKYSIQFTRLRMQDGDRGSLGFLDGLQITALPGVADADHSVPVHVEWLNYSGLDRHHEDIARGRIHSLCHILDTEKPNSLQTLRFLGYVQNHADKLIGIVSLVGDRRKHLVSLRQILTKDKSASGSSYPRLTLDQRFSLALQLSKVFLELHTARWLHRGFSSHCVLLEAATINEANTPSGATTTTTSVQCNTAVVCGFQYARPAGKSQISLPLDSGDLTQRMWYLHPDVRRGSSGLSNPQSGYTRYQAQHDIFSLGIVLLEIGMGKPLEKIFYPKEIPDLDAEKFVATLRSRADGNLPFFMGRRYTEIVARCLGGRASSAQSSPELGAQSDEDNDNVMILKSVLDDIVLTLEDCNGSNL